MTIVRANSFDYVKTLPAGSADLIIIDPPYGRILNIGWDQKWNETLQHKVSGLIVHALRPGGTAYVWGGIGKPKDRIFFNWLGAVEETHPEITVYDVITWKKKRFYGKADAYGFAREECAMLVKGKKPATFNVPYLEEKRGYAGFNKDYPAKSEFKRRTNVWDDVSDMMRGKIHPAEKPVRLAEIMIETSSNPGDMVLDFFAGSGSTGVAAKKLDRRYLLVEASDCAMHPGIE